MFWRRSTDGLREPVALENQFAGPVPTACWIIGGGPSLARLNLAALTASPAPKFAINLAGSGLLRPQFWTSYDPTCRFHRSIYLDPSVTKFVHAPRAMDLVPETTFKVCECPALFLFDRDKQRGFTTFPGQGSAPITDWQDSLIQAIDLAYRLGFRDLYLVGSEMQIAPSRELLKIALAAGVAWQRGELLGNLVRGCERQGLSREALESLSTGPQYHFSETKSLAAAIQTDFHYYRVCQYLRLARRAMALAGLRLFSVTPHSRLNAFFPHFTLAAACARILAQTGDPRTETTQGRYSRPEKRQPDTARGTRDFKPHFWNAAGEPDPVKTPPEQPPALRSKLQQAVEALPEIVVDLNAPEK